MIEPISFNDKNGGVVDFVDDYFRRNSDPLFLCVTYASQLSKAFIITAGGSHGVDWTIAIHKAPHLAFTSERNLDILQQHFPQFVEWYLFHPEFL